MKIYTKTGDGGETGLFGGPRVRKDDARIEAYGSVDELNAAIGAARGALPPAEIDDWLRRIQNELFCLGAELATPDPAARGTNLLDECHVAELEHAIDHFENGLAPLRQFILPGGTPAAAALHVARTICRRAERRVVTLSCLPDHPVSERSLRYLNRLGDFLFVLARSANAQAGVGDTPWEKPVRECRRTKVE